MKRFSKILTLILALAAILTAFTVVALAEGETEPGFVRPFAATTFNGYTVGASWETSQGVGDGGALTVQEAYSGGNRYLQVVGSSNSKSSLNYSYMGGGTNSNRTGYNTIKYPIVAFDFDLMTPNGDWGLYSTTSHNTGNSAGIYFRPYYYNSAGSWVVSNGWFKQISFGALGLPTTAYQWHHVTVVFEQTSETVDDVTTYYVEQTVYVNGQALTNSLASWVSGGEVDVTANGSVDGRLFFGPVYIKSSRYETNSKQVIDNMQYTYYQAGYDISKIPTAIYNDTWEAPFGKLLATVTVGEGEEAVTTYYDDMGEAVEYTKATPGAKLSLAGNMTSNYIVDGEMTIDANIYGTDAETGETIITGKYTGVDTYAKTTKGYYMKETAEGSGIYVATKGDFMLTTSAGVGTAYTADQLAAKLRSPGSGSTIKLLADIDFDPSLRLKTSGSSAGSAEEGAIGVTTNFTLDLNGYSLRRVYYYGNEYVADENGVYPEEATAVAAKNTSLFDMENKAAVLNITSTAGTNGKIYNVGVKCDTYVKNGEIEKREITSYVHTFLIYSITSGAKIDISNTDIYAAKILGAVWGNNFVTVRMNNSNFYQMSKGTASSISSNGEWIFQFHGNAGYDIQVENSLFYLNAPVDNSYTDGLSSYGTVGLFRSNEATPDGKTLISTFKNCDIISAEGKHTAGIFNANPDETLVFEDCRFYNNDIQTNFVASKGTLSNYGYSDPVNRKYHTYPPTPVAGWSNEDISISLDYTVPAVDGWTATEGEVQSVDFSFGTKTQSCKFNKITTKAIDVTLKVDGQEDKTVQLIPGVSDIYAEKALKVYAEEADNLLNTIYILKDANGNVYDSILGLTENGIVADWENGYVLTASEQTRLIGGIEAEFNLGFLSGFRYNLYIPVDARLSNVEVEGYEKGSSTVLIGGVEYTVFSSIVGTSKAAKASTINATFEVDGKAYSQTWSISAVQYAEYLIANPSVYPNETATLGNMVKFIKDTVLTLDATADVSELEAVIASAGVEAGYKTYTDGNAGVFAEFYGTLANVQFTVYNGVASYKFTTVSEGTAFSATVNGKEIGFTVDGTTIVLEPMRVYDLIDPITITVGETTATVSMLDYLTAMEGVSGMNFVKSLYEFGLAAKAYKQDIMANNN